MAVPVTRRIGSLPVVLDDGNQCVYSAGLTAMNQSGSWYFYLADGLGSTMAVVEASGAVQDSYTYDVYSTPPKTGSLANEFDFAGQQTDGTGLQYLRARYYDPATGTFLSRDPMASNAPWDQNGVAYSGANPASFKDLTGLCASFEDGCDWWRWKRVSSEILHSHKWSLDELNGGFVAPIIKKARAKFGAGVCVEVVSCEYRVTKTLYRSRVTGEENKIIRHEFFLNVKIGFGTGIWGIGICVGLYPMDIPIPNPFLPGSDMGGCW